MDITKNDSMSGLKEATRQRKRLQMSGLGIINAIVQSCVMALFSVAGTIPVWIAIAFFVVSTGVSAGFYSFIWFGLNIRLRDKGMLMPQLLGSLCIQVLFLILAPNLAVLFLLALFVTMGYGAIQFSPRQFTIAWVLYGGVTAIALWLVKEKFGYPGVSGFEIVLVWLWYFMALRLQTNTSVQFSHLRDQLYKKNQELKVSLEKIEELANHDYLTGVLNRRSLVDILDAELQRLHRTHQLFCYAMIDLDHFKNINDQFGHPIGDAVLIQVAKCANKSLRALDRFGRLGGEEFGIVLPATGLDQCRIVMERLRIDVAEYDWDKIETGLCVTFSAGITAVVPGDTLDLITKRVDQALYRAKHEGRNRVICIE